MSSVCIFNIVDEINSYDRLNHIVRELVQTALDNELGISFCSNYYNLMELPTMKNYFLLSDSFIYRHSDELLSPNELWDEVGISSYKKKFISQFKFFQTLINKLFSLDIEKVEIYFADADEPIDSLKDFEIVQINGDNFVSSLLNIVLKKMDEWGGAIPNFLKFEIIKPDLVI